MGFWIFMLVMNLLIPLIMIGFGSYFVKSAPKEINWIFGYRTSMSMKNKDTWTFAHNHCGKLWRFIGWIMFPVSVGAMFYVFCKDVNTVGIFGLVLTGIQTVFLIASIIPTEMALRKNFDKDGNRRLKS